MKYALLIGLTNVDPAEYNGWDGELKAPVNDVNAMSKLIAADHTKVIVNQDATIDEVSNTLIDLSEILEPKDKIYIYYSGHGATVSDKNRDEIDGKDETWCLYDGMILDDDISSLLNNFKRNVSVTVISDSCHSGTITKNSYSSFFQNRIKKMLPSGYFNYNIKLNVKRVPNYKLGNQKPNILTLSACQDFQYAYDGDQYSLFTEILINVYEMYPELQKNYVDFMEQVRSQMPISQTPRLGYRNGINAIYKNVFG